MNEVIVHCGSGPPPPSPHSRPRTAFPAFLAPTSTSSPAARSPSATSSARARSSGWTPRRRKKSLVAIDPLRAARVVPKCGKALSRSDLRWVSMGERREKATVECGLCHSEFPTPEPRHGAPLPPRDRPEPDPRGVHGSDPVPRAQLRSPQHDGSGDGEAGARRRIGQLSPTARHSRAPAPLPAGAAAPDADDALRALHRAAGGAELRRRRPLLRGVQHPGRARLLEGRDRARSRTHVVLPDVPW